METDYTQRAVFEPRRPALWPSTVAVIDLAQCGSGLFVILSWQSSQTREFRMSPFLKRAGGLNCEFLAAAQLC